MSMLAECKQKVKWVINSTKKPLWKTDQGSTTFGLQLMEKMGWTPGKGLGIHEQGTPEPIALGFKNDKKGMGFKETDDDWIQNQEEFNLLLNSLANAETNKISVAGKDFVKNDVESLEEKSKKSKSRVHYQKFTRGKDLSRYSENDLACIIGSRKRKAKDENEPTRKKESTYLEAENTFGVTTLNGGSIVDYFRSKRGMREESPNCGNSARCHSGKDPSAEACDSNSNKKYKLKRKRKKSKNRDENLEATATGSETTVDERDRAFSRTEKREKDKRCEEEKFLKSEDNKNSFGDRNLVLERNLDSDSKFEKNVFLNFKTERCIENQEKIDEIDKKKKKKKKKRREEELGKECLKPNYKSVSSEESQEQEKFDSKDELFNSVAQKIPEEITCLSYKNVVGEATKGKENQSKNFKKRGSRNKIFDLICDAQVSKFKGSNLEALTGYGYKR